MTKQDLAIELRKMCDAHKDDEPTMIRLFGIKYAEEIKNYTSDLNFGSYRDCIELSKIELAKNYKLTRKELNEVEKIIEEHYNDFIKAWEEHFGN